MTCQKPTDVGLRNIWRIRERLTIRRIEHEATRSQGFNHSPDHGSGGAETPRVKMSQIRFDAFLEGVLEPERVHHESRIIYEASVKVGKCQFLQGPDVPKCTYKGSKELLNAYEGSARF